VIAGEDGDGRVGAFERARAGVVKRLHARRPEIDEAIFARVSNVAPDPVGFADPEYLEGLRAAVAAAVDYVLTGIEQVGEASPRIPSAAVAQARRAARAGVSMDVLLRRYVAGHALLGDFVMQETDHSDFVGHRTALRGMLGSSASLLDRLIPSIASAYMQELEQAGSPPARKDQAPVRKPRRQSVPRKGSEDARPDAVGRDASVPAGLGNPSARRARECLLFLAEHPGSSNREVAAGIGVAHQSQISKLLCHLVGEGLVIKRSEGVGKRNEWRLTPHGGQIARALSELEQLTR
jgi:hypothetical protein